MWKIVLRRFSFLCLTCLIVSVIAFLLPCMSGDDPVRAILRSRSADLALDPAAVEALRRQLGLDQPLYVRYFSWLSQALSGNLGASLIDHAPVSGKLSQALSVSVSLAALALGVAFLLAFPLGTLCALRPHGKFDNVVTFITQTFVAVPEYWLAPVCILFFSLHLGWLPSAGWHGFDSMMMPALVLSLRPMAYFVRVTRAAMIEVLAAPYITAARSRGLTMRQTVLRHGVRNGAMPVVSLFALWLAGLLGGAVVVEVIFSIPGMGRLIFEAMVNNDAPVLQGGFICIVMLSIAINTLGDIIQAALNPALRIRHVH